MRVGAIDKCIIMGTQLSYFRGRRKDTPTYAMRSVAYTITLGLTASHYAAKSKDN